MWVLKVLRQTLVMYERVKILLEHYGPFFDTCCLAPQFRWWYYSTCYSQTLEPSQSVYLFIVFITMGNSVLGEGTFRSTCCPFWSKFFWSEKNQGILGTLGCLRLFSKHFHWIARFSSTKSCQIILTSSKTWSPRVCHQHAEIMVDGDLDELNCPYYIWHRCQVDLEYLSWLWTIHAP